MPASTRQIAVQDLIPDHLYALERKTRRVALLPSKRLRRVPLGPHCTLIFESYETMLFQVQEMLLTEKGGAAQVPDELAAYNPLIPRGHELMATIMFEIDEPVRRAAILASLGDVEDHFFIKVGDERVDGVPEEDIERTREDGKTSSVHFHRFPFTVAQIRAFRDTAVPVMIGCDHPRYGHLAVVSDDTRAELAKDFV